LMKRTPKKIKTQKKRRIGLMPLDHYAPLIVSPISIKLWICLEILCHTVSCSTLCIFLLIFSIWWSNSHWMCTLSVWSLNTSLEGKHLLSTLKVGVLMDTTIPFSGE
jgi:hypothetical protein